jgi:PD-(D/E)XK endonuclease
MQLKQKNTKKQGDVGMGVAIGYFASRGITVCLPLTDSQDYDLVVDMDGVLKRIQVKTTAAKSRGKTGFDVHLKVSGGNRSGTGKTKPFDPSKVDFVFVLTERWDQYLIPSHAIKGLKMIIVGNQAYREFLVDSRVPFEVPGELFKDKE